MRILECSHAFAIVVSPSNQIVGLTEGQISDIFSGIVRDFGEVGWQSGINIQVLGRKPDVSSRKQFRKIALKTGIYAEGMKIFDSDEDIIEAFLEPMNETMITLYSRQLITRWAGPPQDHNTTALVFQRFPPLEVFYPAVRNTQ